MANSFIGELGRKYDKINHGCTYTEYDTMITEKTCALMTVMLKKEMVCYIMNRLAVVKHKSSVSWLNSQKSVLCCLLLIKP